VSCLYVQKDAQATSWPWHHLPCYSPVPMSYDWFWLYWPKIQEYQMQARLHRPQ
jgi:hypothetical protein